MLKHKKQGTTIQHELTERDALKILETNDSNVLVSFLILCDFKRLVSCLSIFVNKINI